MAESLVAAGNNRYGVREPTELVLPGRTYVYQEAVGEGRTVRLPEFTRRRISRSCAIQV